MRLEYFLKMCALATSRTAAWVVERAPGWELEALGSSSAAASH